MKLWKFVAIVLMLCGAALSIFLSRILLSTKAHVLPHFDHSSTLLSASTSASALSMSSNNNSSGTGRKFRRVRSANRDSLVISDIMHVFQSFTEGELKQVIRTVMQRKAQREAKLGKRTKRAKMGTKTCTLIEKDLTVSQLDLGYDSDEVIRFRYCSGKCVASRRNYDLVLKKLKKQNLVTGKNKERARHSPCCRPSAYEEITFLDNNSKYHTIYEVSALNCTCE